LEMSGRLGVIEGTAVLSRFRYLYLDSPNGPIRLIPTTASMRLLSVLCIGKITLQEKDVTDSK
jgi:hypothetical protein